VVNDRDATARENRAMKFACRSVPIHGAMPSSLRMRTRTLGSARQMSRVDAGKDAIEKSRCSLAGSAVASDAFLPFPDTPRSCRRGRRHRTGRSQAARSGIRKVIEAANRWELR
jgi:phosphoribosylaminoimidazolecarboxamide formyltransferase/IMP cyclohydrolase